MGKGLDQTFFRRRQTNKWLIGPSLPTLLHLPPPLTSWPASSPASRCSSHADPFALPRQCRPLPGVRSPPVLTAFQSCSHLSLSLGYGQRCDGNSILPRPSCSLSVQTDMNMLLPVCCQPVHRCGPASSQDGDFASVGPDVYSPAHPAQLVCVE